MPTPVAETPAAYTVVALVDGAPRDWEACLAALPAFGVADFAVAGLLMLDDAEVRAAGAIAQRLDLPLATVITAIARLEASTIVGTDPPD
jgi:hypothetical protein